MVKVNNHEATVGCYIDGHWGQYAPDRLAEIAEGFGMTIEPQVDPRLWRDWVDNHAPLSADGEAHVFESVIEGADQILEWLNDNTEEGYYWEWMDGELFLTPERTAMRTRTSRIGGNLVAECDHCGNVCVLWDDDDLEGGVLYCYHTED